MPIAPQTEIDLLAGVPLSPDYTNTLTFADRGAQYDYFFSKHVKHFQRQSYQRVDDGVLEVQCPPEEIYHCNYLMFKNFGHGPKWFYAFITRVEYVNEVTSRVYYTVDVMQTYYMDVQLSDCFVQREHTNNDDIGANLQPENVETGQLWEYEILNFTPHYSDAFKICLVCTFDKLFEDTVPSMRNGIYNALSYNIFEDAAGATAWIEQAIAESKFDGILAAFMVPTYISTVPAPAPMTGTIPFKGQFGGYTPKNNKLYTYPYNFLMVITDKDEQTFRWEYCRGGKGLEWSATGYLSPNPVCVWRPTNYACTPAEQNGLNYRMVLDDVPQVSIAADVYKLYLADQYKREMVGIVGQAVNAIGNAAAGNIPGAISGAAGLFDSVVNQVTNQILLSEKAPIVKGQQISSADYACSAKAFRAHYMGVTAEYAKLIDNYFTMFGYATNQVKKPNVTGRSAFNYVKTVGCNAIGDAPASAIGELNRIFDQGVTFWHNPETVGDYSQANGIVRG